MHPGTTPKVRQDSGGDPITLAPFAVALDWLTLSMHGAPGTFRRTEPWPFRSEELAPGRQFVLRPTPHSTPVFSTVAYIEDEDGEKVATITADPHNLTCGPDTWFHLQFANRTLYTGEWITLYHIIRWAMGCTFASICRVDIACDGLDGDGGDYFSAIQRSWTGEARYYGKADWRPRFRRARIEGAEFGTRASNKFMRAYNKTRELKQVHRKPHIESHWTMKLGWNPMDTGAQVNRLELQVKGKEVRRYFARENDEHWVMSLAKPTEQVRLFASMVPKVFDFRIPAERARDAVPIVAWDWTRLTERPPILAERAPKTYAMTDHSVKVVLKKMWEMSHVTCNSEPHSFALAFASNVGPHMVEWYNSRQQQWRKELAHRRQDARTAAILDRMANGEVLEDPLQ